MASKPPQNVTTSHYHLNTVGGSILLRTPQATDQRATTRHCFRGYQKTASASVKLLRTVCFCVEEHSTGMALPPQLVGLNDCWPELSESVRRVLLAISVMTSSHNNDKDAALLDQEGIAGDETGAYS